MIDSVKKMKLLAGSVLMSVFTLGLGQEVCGMAGGNENNPDGSQLNQNSAPIVNIIRSAEMLVAQNNERNAVRRNRRHGHGSNLHYNERVQNGAEEIANQMFTPMWTRDNTNLGDAIATMEAPNGNRSIVRVNMERAVYRGTVPVLADTDFNTAVNDFSNIMNSLNNRQWNEETPTSLSGRIQPMVANRDSIGGRTRHILSRHFVNRGRISVDNRHNHTDVFLLPGRNGQYNTLLSLLGRGEITTNTARHFWEDQGNIYGDMRVTIRFTNPNNEIWYVRLNRGQATTSLPERCTGATLIFKLVRTLHNNYVWQLRTLWGSTEGARLN